MNHNLLLNRLNDRLGWLRINIKDPYHITIFETEYKYMLDLFNELSKTDIKLNDSTCPHCQFLSETFGNHAESTDREYWLMTEVFVYLHGGDFCEHSNKLKPLTVKSIDG